MSESSRTSSPKNPRAPWWPTLLLMGVGVQYGRMLFEVSLPTTWTSIDRVLDLLVLASPAIVKVPGFYVLSFMTFMALFEIAYLIRRCFVWLLPGKGSLTKGSLAKVELS